MILATRNIWSLSMFVLSIQVLLLNTVVVIESFQGYHQLGWKRHFSKRKFGDPLIIFSMPHGDSSWLDENGDKDWRQPDKKLPSKKTKMLMTKDSVVKTTMAKLPTITSATTSAATRTQARRRTNSITRRRTHTQTTRTTTRTPIQTTRRRMPQKPTSPQGQYHFYGTQKEQQESSSSSSSVSCCWLYTLRLQGGMFYVGITNQDPQERLQQHLLGGSMAAAWTKKFPPIDLLECEQFPEQFPENNARMEENNKVYEYMIEYGIERVRGGRYCQVKLSPSTKRELQLNLWHIQGLCYHCGGNHFANTCCFAKKTW